MRAGGTVAPSLGSRGRRRGRTAALSEHREAERLGQMKWHLRKLSRSRRCHGVVDASGGRSVQRRPGERPSSCRNRAAAVGSEGGPAVPNSGVFGSKRVGGGEGGAGRLRMSFTAHMDAVAAVFDPGGPRRRATVPTRVSMGFVGRGVDGSKRGGGLGWCPSVLGSRRTLRVRRGMGRVERGPLSTRAALCRCSGVVAASNSPCTSILARTGLAAGRGVGGVACSPYGHRSSNRACGRVGAQAGCTPAW